MNVAFWSPHSRTAYLMHRYVAFNRQQEGEKNARRFRGIGNGKLYVGGVVGYAEAKTLKPGF